MKLYRTNINDLINVLSVTKEACGNLNLPVYTYNENDNSVIYDFILSDKMEISLANIVETNGKIYIQDKGFDEWLRDNIDEYEDSILKFISKEYPESEDMAIKVLKNEYIDDGDWDILMPIINHYYLTELEWQKVVLITNYSCN